MSPTSRFVTALAVSGAVTVAGLALGVGTAQADPFPAQPHSWCPGEALPFHNIQWVRVCATPGTPFHSARAKCGWSISRGIRLTASSRRTFRPQC
jgi:hypothetical protein